MTDGDDYTPKFPGRHSPGCPCPPCERERERDSLPDNVIPIGTRAASRMQSRPYLEPPERYDEVASVAKLLDADAQPVGRIGLWFYIRDYPGIALTPTQARALGQLLTLAANDVEPPPTEPGA